MKTLDDFRRRPTARGFTLIEMMVVIVIVSIVIAAVLTQVNQTQQRATAEEGKLDQFQAARTFIGQISSDAREMGYPNIHNFDVSAWTLPQYIDDHRVGGGLLKLTPSQLIFEGDVDGSGNVSIVSYTVNGDGACANCLERAQVMKTDSAATDNSDYLTWAEGLVSAAGYSAEIQNVQNTNNIFTAYDYSGNALPASMDIGSDPTDIAKTRMIQISLDVSDPTKLDPKTRQALEANMTTRVQVVNCSMATAGWATPGGLQLTCQ
jgi:prepilin-type N-terminal cleavage/methylation domain-containing protein